MFFVRHFFYALPILDVREVLFDLRVATVTAHDQIKFIPPPPVVVQPPPPPPGCLV